MTVEADIYTAINALVGGRVFPDVAPITTPKPYITYSQVGGEAVFYTENALPDTENARFQFNVWADTRATAKSLIKQIEFALVMSNAFQARPDGASHSQYDNDMLTYGSMQDFSIWSTR